MDLYLNDRLMLVLGGSEGLGLACARVLAEEGARLILSSRSMEKLEKAAGSLKGITEPAIIPADVSRVDDLEELHRKVILDHGIPDGIILNAGGPPVGRTMEMGDREWMQALETNLLSGVRTCRLFVPEMVKRKYGRIVAIASSGVKQALAGLVLSNSARMGLQGYLKTLSNEVARHNVLVNMLLPGPTETGRLQSILEKNAATEGKTLEEIVKERAEKIPAGRFGQPHELAGLAAFLISPRNTYITGQAIAVDGGYVQSNL